MHFVGWNLVICTWLLISAFVFAQPPISVAQTSLTAVLALLFAYLSPSKPGLRFVITVLAFLLGATALLMPGVSTVAAFNNGTVAVLLFVLSAVRPSLSQQADQPAKP
ncbi:MAG TPA: hypothetical protein VFL83_01110 [Anaeromyxobacter sp.]|nr:hypothetical protein [Anaeromyxobacter sp.]